MTQDAARPTERQETALAEHITRARDRYGIEAPPWRDAYPWVTTFDDEVRPGRGRDMTTVYLDGEHLLLIQLNVYGYGHGLSVAEIEWKHSDGAEDCECEYCTAKREGDA